MKWKNKYMLAVLLVLSMFCLTACSGERVQRQLAHREEGIAFLEAEEYEQAIESFQLALDETLGKIDETTLDICFYKARAHYLAGDTDSAMNIYNAIINYNQSPQAYFLRGNLYYTLGKEDETFADYKKAAELETRDYELYIGIYDVLMEMGKEKEAQEYLNKALDMEIRNAADKLQRGRINLLLGEYKDAISILEEASVSEVDANFYLAEVYEAMGDKKNADKYLNSYMESNKIDSYKLYEVGNDKMQKRDYKTAITCFKKALDLEEVPNEQQIMKELICAYELIYDFDSAKSYMKKYVKQYPEDEEAIREYTFLETR